MRFLGRWLVRLLAIVGAVGLIVVLVVVSVGWRISERLAEGIVSVPEAFVLTADWRGGVPEKAPGLTPLVQLGIDRGLGLPEALWALDRAAEDPRVKGLVVRTDGSGFGLAQAWELRAAVQRLRDAGKFTAVYADSLGELQGGMVGTYVASAFERVQLQPLGVLGFTGLSSEQVYLARLLDELQIDFQVVQRDAFKTALEPLVRDGPSPAAAATTGRLLDGLFDLLITGIAEARGLDRAEVQAALDRGPLLGTEAEELGLVDAIDHFEALGPVVDTAAGTDERVELASYARSEGFALGEAGYVVGFVHAVGPILRGENDALRDLDIAADSLAAAIDEAREANVDALLLRVSSPGGSAVASETVAAAVRRTKAAGIPVVVSMGDVAASGGYWISMDADLIVAAPATLTGSIGVVAGKPALRAFLDDLGIDVAIERRGANAGFNSLIDPWDTRARQRVAALIDDLYEHFLEGVSAGRGMDLTQVRSLAGGRVWLGTEAQANGLVDQLGGFVEALDVARERTGAETDDAVALQRFPQPRPPLAVALEGLDRFMRISADLDLWWTRLNAPPGLRFEASNLPSAP